MAYTPFMNLDLPVVTLTVGPLWATQLNAAIDSIDAHDHTSAKGKQIPSAGININANLDLNSFTLFNALSLQFETQSAALTGASNALSLNVSGGNLYYTNAAGSAVQITSGGSIVASPGATISFVTTAVAGDVTIAPADPYVVLSVNTAAARAITLPSVSAVAAGRIYIIKDVSGTSNTNSITLLPDSSDTFDGEASVTVDSSYGAVMIIGDGSSNWQIV